MLIPSLSINLIFLMICHMLPQTPPECPSSRNQDFQDQKSSPYHWCTTPPPKNNQDGSKLQVITGQCSADSCAISPMTFLLQYMYMSLSDDERWFVRDSSLWTLEIWDIVQDKCFSWQIFFPTKRYFSQIEFLSGILSAQLYFVCNHLIFKVSASLFFSVSLSLCPLWLIHVFFKLHSFV